MDAKMKQLLQDLVNKSYEEHVQTGKTLIGASYGVLTKVTDEDKASQLLSLFIASVLAADGTFSTLEKRFLDDVFGESANHIVQLARSIDKEMYDLIDQMVDMLNPEDKAVLMYLACTIAALDETINKNEIAYIEKLLA